MLHFNPNNNSDSDITEIKERTELKRLTARIDNNLSSAVSDIANSRQCEQDNSGKKKIMNNKVNRKKKTENIFNEIKQRRKYRKGVNKYLDPTTIINKLAAREAKRNGSVPVLLTLPAHVQAKIDAKKKKKITAQQRHENKMTRYDDELQFYQLITKNQCRKNQSTKNDTNHGVNKTAFKYQKTLSIKGPFRNNNNYKLTSYELYPKFKCIEEFTENKTYKISNSGCWKYINKWFLEGLDSKDPFKHIKDDAILIKRCKEKSLNIPGEAYKHRSPHACTVDSLREFKAYIRKYCGGKKDTEYKAIDFPNYICMNIGKQYNGNVASTTCIACNLGLQAIPLFCIGTANIYHQGQSFKVYLYLVAYLCINFPYCTFPRSRKNYKKSWIKCAWFNDIPGQLYQYQLNQKRQLNKQRPLNKKRKLTEINDNNDNHNQNHNNEPKQKKQRIEESSDSELSSEFDESPDNVSPANISPVNVSPVNVSPVSVSPGTVSPETVSPETVSPVNVSSVNVSPETVSPPSTFNFTLNLPSLNY